MTLGLLMDVMVTALLLATIIFCYLLNRRITVLKQSSNLMSKLITGFDASIQKARESIDALERAAGATGVDLQDKIDVATALRDELMVVSESSQSDANHSFGGLSFEEHQGEKKMVDEAGKGQLGEAITTNSLAKRELAQILRKVR